MYCNFEQNYGMQLRKLVSVNLDSEKKLPREGKVEFETFEETASSPKQRVRTEHFILFVATSYFTSKSGIKPFLKLRNEFFHIGVRLNSAKSN